LSLVQRIVGVIFSPRSTFESVVAWPQWFPVYLVTILTTVVLWSAFLFSPVGSQAFMDQVTTQAERAAVQQGRNPAQAVENTQKAFPFIRGITMAAIVVVPTIFLLIIAGLAFAIFGAILGGGGTFKQVLAVVAYAGVVQVVAGIFILLMNYLRGSMTSMTNLGVFMPNLPEDSFLFHFLSAIDLIWLWYLSILGIGLGVLYHRKTSSIVVSFLTVYLVIAIIFAVIKGAMA
jgi:hypothetical protein